MLLDLDTTMHTIYEVEDTQVDIIQTEAQRIKENYIYLRIAKI